MKSNAGFFRWSRAVLLALPALFILAGCEGGGSIVAGGGTGGTGISAGVITGKGSVIVNDVRFTVDNNTLIRLNDLPASESDLQIGMIVKLRGTFSADGSNGTAESIEAESNVKGRISLFGPEQDSFSVLGQKNFVDNQTIFVGVRGLNDLELDNVVRVFGFRDVQGDIRATFVERLSVSEEEEEEEVFGIVKNKGANTFELGFLVVDYVTRNPEIDPSGFENGDPVEVEGEFNVARNVFEATEIKREDIEDAGFVPGEGEKVEVEGFTSDVLEISPGIFTLFVDGLPVRTDGGTSHEGGATGTSADLINNVRVEAEGVWTMIGGDLVLLAERIEFE